MQKKDFWKGAITGFLIAVVIWCFICFWPSQGKSFVDSKKNLSKIKQIESVINQAYLEKPNKDKEAEGIYAGLVAGLQDPYSNYFTKEQIKAFDDETEGHYIGIGILMTLEKKKGVLVQDAYKGGAAYEAGVRKGDIITRLDGKSLEDDGVEYIAKNIKNHPGKIIKLTYIPKNQKNEKTVELKVGTVDLPSVFSEELKNKIGYIQITEFRANTEEQFNKQLTNLKEKGIKGLIIDLRNNPGGLITSVVGCLEDIMPKGTLVYTMDKHKKKQEYTSDGKNTLELPLAVVVNGDSASASEIFAGAVQDYGVGTIVGETTFGKGVVQSMFNLPDDSAVKLTVAKYYTPKGRMIHKKGIKPDKEVNLDQGVIFTSDLPHNEDKQLEEAIKVVEKKFKES